MRRISGQPRSFAVTRKWFIVATCVVIFLVVASCSRPPRWNVLVVTFDTTRSDHLGCYGNDAISTPTVDRLAAEGVLFENAYSSVPLTLPSHSTIFTGRYPVAHGVRDNGLFVLPQEQLTLAEMLKAHGYATAASIGGFPLDAKFGIGQGFDVYDDHLTRRYEDYQGRRHKPKTRIFFDERRAARVNEAIYPWLESVSDQPFFLWVHYYDPHQPHEPPPPYDETYANDPYSGEIAYSDESLGVLLDHLARLGVYDRTLVIFTSDHGEGLYEHNESTHAFLLYNTTLHVPLIVRPPKWNTPRRVPQRVGSVDIVPTVLELLDLPLPEDLQGRSLTRLLEGATPASQRPHYGETLSPRFANDWGELRTLYDGRWKYIHGPRPELFDIETDHDELTNLASSEPDVAADMRSRLEALIQSRARASTAAAAAELDAETRERLMALGYLQGGSEVGLIEEELVDGGVAPQDRIADVNTVSAIRNLLYEGRTLAAREQVLQLLAEDSQNRFYLELLAHAEASLGRIDEAQAAIDRIRESSSASVPEELLLRIARHLYYDRGQRAEALRRVEDSLTATASAEALHLRSKMLAGEGRFDESLEDLERALERDPDFGPAQVDMAIRRAQRGDREGAEGAFLNLLQKQPYYAKAQYNYGVFLVEKGDLQGANERFHRAFEIDAGYSQAYYAAIALRIDAGDHVRAEELLTALEESVPNSGEARLARRLLEGR